MNTSPILNAAIQFINPEADLLDQGEFREWLALWRAEGMYIIPIDQQTTDFANVLNYAYDNHEMREKNACSVYTAANRSPPPRARALSA